MSATDTVADLQQRLIEKLNATPVGTFEQMMKRVDRFPVQKHEGSKATHEWIDGDLLRTARRKQDPDESD